MKKFCLALLFSLILPIQIHAAAAVTGQEAPAIPSPIWKDGKLHRLSDYKNKKVTVLFIWNLDQQAIVNIPVMIRVVNAADPAKVAFLGVAGGTVEMINKFPGIAGLNFPICADHKRATAKIYLRRYDKLPLAVVIGRDGKLCWRGSIKQVPAVLKQIDSGKFDLAERIRAEKFSDAVSTAIREKKFKEAFKLINDEWQKHPENLELLSMQLLILTRHLQKSEQAFELIKNAHSRLPGNPAVYELEFQLIRNTAKLALLDDFVNRTIAAHAANPDLILQFAGMVVQIPARDLNLSWIHRMLQSGWKNGKFKTPADKGKFAIDYAKMMHNFGRTDLAYKLALWASQNLKDQAREGAVEAAAYYKKIMDFAPSIEI